MDKLEIMYCINQFNQYKRTDIKRAISYIAPVMVESCKRKLSEDMKAIYNKHIRPVIIELRQKSMNVETLTSVETIAKLAREVKEWFELNPMSGETRVVARVAFKRTYNLA